MDETDDARKTQERLERELEQARRRIAELEGTRGASLALQDEHLALLSHDLRAPLSVIIGRAGLLQRRLAEHDLPRETAGAEAILRNGHRMNSMIQDLVDVVRLEAGRLPLRRSSVELRALLGWTLSLRLSEADRPRVVLDERGGPLPPVAVDAERIGRVVCNLVAHLLRASGGEAPVQVKVEPRGAEAVVAVAGGGAELRPEELEPHFERLAHGDTGQGAWGLGLYVSRLIVEAHGGRLWAEGHAELGCCLAFALPFGTADETPLESEGGE